jgi:leader peptidase (prepilin peptidase) / N-methyltransferase
MHMPGQVPTWLLAVIAAAAGVMVGSFLAVRADLMRADQVRADLMRADLMRADQVRAGRMLAGLPRGGRAPTVRARGGWAPGGQRLAVELGTGACFAVMALRFGPSPVLPAFLLLAALAPVLTLTDLRWRRLPDPLTLPAYPAAAALLAAGALAIPGGARHFLSALAGLAAAWLFFALLAGIHPAGLGGGDVKLSGVLGLYLGWLGAAAVAAGLLGAFVLAALAGLGLIAAGRATRKTQIPFGPFMLASAVLVIAASGLVPALAR